MFPVRSLRVSDSFTTRLVIAVVVLLPVPMSAVADNPTTASGRPDFTGTYNTATLTPLERPVAFGVPKVRHTITWGR